MDFTTTTEIARKGGKIFLEYDEVIVLKNNTPLGLLLGGELSKAVIDSGVIGRIRKQLLDKKKKKYNDFQIEPLSGSEEFIGSKQHKELISLMKSA